MKIIQGHGAKSYKVILSLCDYSGNWPKPFTDAGYAAVLIDLKHGDDVTLKPVPAPSSSTCYGSASAYLGTSRKVKAYEPDENDTAGAAGKRQREADEEGHERLLHRHFVGGV